METLALKNRSDLIRAMKEQGLVGPYTPESIKAFAAEHGIEIEDSAVDELWEKTVKLGKAEETPPVVEADPGEDETVKKMAALEAQVKDLTLKAKVRTGSGAVVDRNYTAVTKAATSTTPLSGRLAIQRKHYQNRITEGKSAFTDVEQAEVFGAWMRSRGMGIHDYPQKTADFEILRNKANNEWLAEMGQKIGSGVVNLTGGALVPTEFDAQMIYLTEPFGVTRRLANVVPMARDTKQQPRKIAIVTMDHIGESGTLTAQDDNFDNVQLTAKAVKCLVRGPTEWIEDSAISVADNYASSFFEAQQRREDKDYLLGDGSSTYGGHVGLAYGLPAATAGVGSGVTNAYLVAASASWASYTIGIFHTAMGSFENADPARCAWLCSRQFFMQVMWRLAHAQAASASGAMATLNGSGSGRGGPDGTFLGWPVYFSQTLPTAGGTSGQTVAYFGDYAAGSMLGDRRAMSVMYSDQRYFDQDQVAWRATARIAVNIHGDGKGSTYGPIVAIQNP